MERLRSEGRNLKKFWEDVRCSCDGQVDARRLQTCIDQLTGQPSAEGKAATGLISAYFCEDDCILTFDDAYDAIVCL